MLKLKLGSKGEILIPKKIREQLGFTRDRIIILEIKEKSVELKASNEDIVKKWEEYAKKHNIDISKWVYGDELYEEEF